ncbi:MAG: phosphotransferase family protein [Ilumatobacteraceae bacterium]
MTEPQRRRVHVLVGNPRTAAVLVTEDGGLPCLDLVVPDGGTTAQAVTAALRARDIDRPLIDVILDQSDLPEGAPVGVVVQIAAPAPLPGGWRWAPATEVVPPDDPPLREYVAARLDEWRGVRPVPPERSAWVEPGWYERVRQWVDDRLVEAGHGPSTEMVPFRVWGISAVFSVTSEGGRHWIKAVHPHFAAEPRVTARLAQLAPGAVPTVVAIEPDEGWLLLEHLDGTGVNEAGDPAGPFAALAALQRRFVGRGDELRALGLPDRRLVSLVDEFREAVAMPLARDVLGADAERSSALARGVAAGVDRVAALGLPDTLLHGDFHPNNVTLHRDDVVVFDWSDAAIGNPIVEIGSWGSWLRDDPPALDHLWRCVAEAWAPTVDPEQVLAARPWAAAVVAAYHVVTYVHIARALEPLRREEALTGVRSFFADLVTALDAAAGAA